MILKKIKKPTIISLTFVNLLMNSTSTLKHPSIETLETKPAENTLEILVVSIKM
jgi:hypothetical protein